MSSDSSPSDALALAEEAYALVDVSPRRAMILAERALARAGAEADQLAAVRAHYALSYAQFQLGDARSLATTKAGIRIAEEIGDRRGAGLLHRRLAFLRAGAGEVRAAARELDTALGLLDGLDRARTEVFRLDIQRRAHAVAPEVQRDVLAHAATALTTLRRAGDEIWEARLLGTRGMLFADRGQVEPAAADLRRAYEAFSRLGARASALEAAGAMAQIALLRGDLVSCLRMLDDVEAALPAGELSYWLQDVRANALAEARLLPEAAAAANSYIEICVQAGLDDEAVLTRLDLAALAMMSGDFARARELATSAVRSFSARGKPVNAALARTMALRARLSEGSLRPSSVRSALSAAAVLETAGWHREALRTRVIAVRVALAMGSRSTASRQLELAGSLRRCGSVTDRVELRYAQALLRLAEGDGAGAERILAAGLRLLDDYRAALGATELRASASGIGVELAQSGLRLALDRGRTTNVLDWAERLHGSTLRLPPVRPSSDPKIRASQIELRRVAARLRAAEESGLPARGAAARQAELESEIRARTRLTRGRAGTDAAPAGPAEAARLLGKRALVEYVELDGRLAAVTCVDGRFAHHEVGPTTATEELEWLRFALVRLARGATTPAEKAAARENARESAGALDRLLVEPLLPTVGDAPLVIVPTGPLHALPWSTLPSLRGRPLVVAPSLAVWLDLARQPRSRRRKTAFVAGPRLRHSASEVRDLASLYSRATVLHGRAATAKETLAALDGAALAHLACHGRFRADSPLFSSLELADGPLNVYELQSLRRAPELVVLSACDLAVSGLQPGDELLGLAAALLGMGTRTIVASIVPVPDAAARRLMLSFHRNLLAGDSPAAALARAQRSGAGAGFVCLGSG